MDSECASGCTWSTARATARLRDSRPRGVVKQDKSSRGSVDTTKTCSGPQRVSMSSGERPIGAAKGKQSDTEALCQPPPPPRVLPQWLRTSDVDKVLPKIQSGGHAWTHQPTHLLSLRGTLPPRSRGSWFVAPAPMGSDAQPPPVLTPVLPATTRRRWHTGGVPWSMCHAKDSRA